MKQADTLSQFILNIALVYAGTEQIWRKSV